MSEDEEWGNENERMSEVRSPSSAGERPPSSGASASPSSNGSPPPPPAHSATHAADRDPPRLRLNTSLATDPALAPRAAPLKREPPSPSPPAVTAQAVAPAAPTAPSRDLLALSAAAAAAFPALFGSSNAPPFVCAPCGIRYSSLSTLQAHQHHYCTHRLTKPSPEPTPSDPGDDAASDAPRPKQYACTYCSYSADKKVSLNRHMRMHSTSPSPAVPPVTNGDSGEVPLPDRYCTDCDIRFSSSKTFRAHKAHYCSTRQVVKQPRTGSGTSGSAPPSPRATPPSPVAAAAAASSGGQLVLALPTNPILIVPYSLLRGASTLPGATLPEPDAPCFLLPNGTIQPMSRALAAAAPSDPKDTDVLKAANREATVPLDLSIRRISVPDPPDEHEKENRARAPTPEQIVCAPSLPGSPVSPCPSPSPRRRSPSPSPKRRRRDSRAPTPKPPSPEEKYAAQPTPPLQPLTLRLSSELSAPQVLVKQGVSKCKECNIVFCKYENYRIHKRHYCSSGGGEERTSPTAEAGPPQHYRQLICLACGIKFSSIDNLATHQSYYCLKREARSPRGGGGGAEGGWKCPCCDVVSGTAAAAQRHMEAHAAVKAFRCTICRYRGNTLRGMRTHIRMHFPKKPADLQEESYIACVVEDDGRETTSPSQTGTSDRIHRCSSCAYTSTYRGNVVRHARLVHAIDEPDEEPPPPEIKREPEEDEGPGPNYCKTCDISFKYVNTYKAHKQFYCVPKESANNNVQPAQVTDAPV